MPPKRVALTYECPCICLIQGLFGRSALVQICSWSVANHSTLREYRRFHPVCFQSYQRAWREEHLLLRQSSRCSQESHFSHRARPVLSDSVYGSTSVAAIGVAAHESGHAIQHKVGYLPLKLRSASVPVANIGSMVSWPVILVGLIFGWIGIARIGVLLFSFVVLFQIITLPVEFNASSRALKVLEESKLLIGGELKGATKVLRAAALTYVAAVFSSILQLLRLILLTRGNSRRR